MLRELVEIKDHLIAEEGMNPSGYKVYGKQSAIKWIIHLYPDGRFRHLEEASGLENMPRPNRQRSGKKGENAKKNAKPYLLADDARYVLGIPEPGKEREAEMLSRAFRDLVEDAWKNTGAADLKAVLNALNGKLHDIPDLSRISPKDVVTFTVNPERYPVNDEQIKQFWAKHINSEFSSAETAQCGICGNNDRLIQKLPLEVVVAGQKCQVTSMTPTAFQSYGKKQTVNARICLRCGVDSPQVLDHLLRQETHTAMLARDDSKGGGQSPMKNQLAVFWLKTVPESAPPPELRISLQEFTKAFTSPLPKKNADAATTPSLMKRFLNIPWNKNKEALRIQDNALFMAVLSANKGRMVLRDWFRVSIAEVKENLKRYVDSAEVPSLNPDEDSDVIFPLGEIIQNLGDSGRRFARGILRVAYLGHPPPTGLLEAAVLRLRNPESRNISKFPIFASIIKLTLAAKEGTVKKSDNHQQTAAFHAGRLLAVLEEVQGRASRGKINTIITDRFYGAVSTVPEAYFPHLIRLAQTAHIPKIRKTNRGYRMLSQRLEETMGSIDKYGGFPKSMAVDDQARFALGYFTEKSELMSRKKKTTNQSAKNETKGAAG